MKNKTWKAVKTQNDDTGICWLGCLHFIVLKILP